MAQLRRRQIQVACDDMFCDPDDAVASAKLRRLLGGAPTSYVAVACDEVSRSSWRRLVRIACDELHDDTDDRDARDRLLLLLAAGGGLAPAVA